MKCFSYEAFKGEILQITRQQYMSQSYGSSMLYTHPYLNSQNINGSDMISQYDYFSNDGIGTLASAWIYMDLWNPCFDMILTSTQTITL